MDTSTESSPGLFSSVKRLLNTALAGVENRIELFLVELREERFRVFEVLLLGWAAAVLGFMALLTVTATLVVIFWDSARVPVLVILSTSYFLGTIAMVWRMKARLRNWSSFSATLDELKKDRACWGKRVKGLGTSPTGIGAAKRNQPPCDQGGVAECAGCTPADGTNRQCSPRRATVVDRAGADSGDSCGAQPAQQRLWFFQGDGSPEVDSAAAGAVETV